MSPRPAVSIITPLLNRAAMLAEALASAAAQRPVAFEHLVVDGGSTDGSREIATKAGATLIEAPGSSIYQALNIGLARARGDIVCLLNSDDRLAPGALAAALEAFASDAALDLVRGRAQVERQDAETWTIVDDGAAQAPAPTLRNVLLGASNINACFFRRDFADRVGPFNPVYRISADREWLARALLSGWRTGGLDRVVYVYRTHPGSLTIGQNKPALATWVREHLAFASQMLAGSGLRGSYRADLRAFFAKETAHLVTLLLVSGNLASAARALVDGFRVDPAWPLHAAGPLADIARRRLSA